MVPDVAALFMIVAVFPAGAALDNVNTFAVIPEAAVIVCCEL